MTAEGTSITVEILSSNDRRDNKKAPMRTIMHLSLTADSNLCQVLEKKGGQFSTKHRKGNEREKFQTTVQQDKALSITKRYQVKH